jgi:hypothetical protein
MTLYRHPAAVPENIRRLMKVHGGLKSFAATTGIPAASVKSWSTGETLPSVQNQKKLARLYFASYPEDVESMIEVLEGDVTQTEQLLDRAMHERTSPKDPSHKPARMNWLLAKIHLNETRQLQRRLAGKDPGPASVVDPDIAEVYGSA